MAGALLQVSLQLSQLHPLWGVGWREQAGWVQRQALVVAHVGLSWEGVLQLQALQLLGQDGLTAAQVTRRDSGLSWFRRCKRVWVYRVGDHLLGRILGDSDRGRGRRLAVCSRLIDRLSLGKVKLINSRRGNIKVSHLLPSHFGGTESSLPAPPLRVRLGFHCEEAGR